MASLASQLLRVLTEVHASGVVLNSIDLDSVVCSMQKPSFTHAEFKLVDLTRATMLPALCGLLKTDFTAPESIDQDKVSTSCDIYSLGALVHYLVHDGHAPEDLSLEHLD